MAALGDVQRLDQQLGRVNARQALAPPQMALAAGKQSMAGARDRALQADGGERVLQHAARTQVHVHIAGGDQRQAALLGQPLEPVEPCAIVGSAQQLHRDPCIAGEAFAEPARVVEARFCRGQQQSEAAGQTMLEIGAGELVFALACLAPAAGDQLREVAVAFTIGGQQHQFQFARFVFLVRVS